MGWPLLLKNMEGLRRSNPEHYQSWMLMKSLHHHRLASNLKPPPYSASALLQTQTLAGCRVLMHSENWQHWNSKWVVLHLIFSVVLHVHSAQPVMMETLRCCKVIQVILYFTHAWKRLEGKPDAPNT